MSKPKFTPGPWEVVLDFPPHERLYVRTHRKKKDEFFDFEKCICGCGFPNGVCDGGNRKANAYLISAAPEMYEIIAELEEMAFSGCASVEDVQNLIQRAIFIAKKARGEN